MIIVPKIFSNFIFVRAGMSTRWRNEGSIEYEMSMGYSGAISPETITHNREFFFQLFNINLSQLAQPQQQHTDTVIVVHKPGIYPSCDGLITMVPNVILTIVVADCVPVLVYDPLRNVVAAIHAGWRGAALGIVRKTIQIMQKRFCTNPALLRCFIGPSAGVCCYEVGFDVAAHFKENVLSSRNRKLYLNLKEEVQQQLIHEGVERVNIEIHQGCTICTPQQFFSYRRDGSQTGRMIAFIGIVEE